MAYEWKYYGDMNIEYGGMFVLDEGDDDFVRAVEVIPCSDAGGPDNLFVVEEGSIYMPTDTAKRNNAISCIGCKILDDGTMNDNGTIVQPDDPAFRLNLIMGFRAYHGMDRDRDHVVQMGKRSEDFGRGWSPEPTAKIRANGNLYRWVENHCCN